MIKYRIRQVTINYSKEKARQRRQKISDIENSRKVLEEKCGNNPTTENIEQLEILKLEHENIYEAFSKGARRQLGMRSERQVTNISSI